VTLPPLPLEICEESGPRRTQRELYPGFDGDRPLKRKERRHHGVSLCLKHSRLLSCNGAGGNRTGWIGLPCVSSDRGRRLRIPCIHAGTRGGYCFLGIWAVSKNWRPSQMRNAHLRNRSCLAASAGRRALHLLALL